MLTDKTPAGQDGQAAAAREATKLAVQGGHRRGVAKLRLGDANGDADINAAKEMFPGIAEQMAQLGITP